MREFMNPHFTFASFASTRESALALRSTVAIARREQISPLLLVGPPGTGKTHLLQAIAHEMDGALYCTADGLGAEFTSAVRREALDKFRAAHLDRSVLLVDDLQHLQERLKVQEELASLLEAFVARGRAVVLASTLPVNSLALEPRLASRLGWALVATLPPPDLEAKGAILAKRLAHHRIVVDDATLAAMARFPVRDARELEGLVLRLSAKASLNDRPLDAAFVEEERASNAGALAPDVTMDAILRAVSLHFHVRVTDLLSTERHKTIAMARHVAMYLCRERLGVSFPEVGRVFNRDHTTVMAAVRKVEALRTRDARLEAHLSVLRAGGMR